MNLRAHFTAGGGAVLRVERFAGGTGARRAPPVVLIAMTAPATRFLVDRLITSTGPTRRRRGPRGRLPHAAPARCAPTRRATTPSLTPIGGIAPASLAAAIAGPALYRRASFLLERLGEHVAARGITVVDDPLVPGAPGSRPFDGEGVTARRRTIVEDGVLRSYLLDAYSARRLGLATTGHAVRGPGDAPSVAPSNFHLLPGRVPPEAIVASVERAST
jgi:PmbA protein